MWMSRTPCGWRDESFPFFFHFFCSHLTPSTPPRPVLISVGLWRVRTCLYKGYFGRGSKFLVQSGSNIIGNSRIQSLDQYNRTALLFQPLVPLGKYLVLSFVCLWNIKCHHIYSFAHAKPLLFLPYIHHHHSSKKLASSWFGLLSPTVA